MTSRKTAAKETVLTATLRHYFTEKRKEQPRVQGPGNEVGPRNNARAEICFFVCLLGFFFRK